MTTVFKHTDRDGDEMTLELAAEHSDRPDDVLLVEATPLAGAYLTGDDVARIREALAPYDTGKPQAPAPGVERKAVGMYTGASYEAEADAYGRRISRTVGFYKTADERRDAAVKTRAEARALDAIADAIEADAEELGQPGEERKRQAEEAAEEAAAAQRRAKEELDRRDRDEVAERLYRAANGGRGRPPAFGWALAKATGAAEPYRAQAAALLEVDPHIAGRFRLHSLGTIAADTIAADTITAETITVRAPGAF